jgi:response regulator RpfG family c-di-GMP phosphodiesterase
VALDTNSKARFNLSKASVLLLDSTPMGLGVLGQILKGFGAGVLFRCTSVDDAKEIAQTEALHLVIADTMSPTGAGYDFVTWMRREAPDPNRYAPIILVDGHTRVVDVSRARNCGSNFLLKRPLSPLSLMERVIWIGGEDRGFVLGETYAGPDRRFKDQPIPGGRGRRWNDKSPEATQAEPESPSTTENPA